MSKTLEPHTHPRPADMQTVSVRSREYQDFLKYIANSTGQASYEQMAILYPAICQAAMEWMLVEKRSVDFGFVILHPSPYRANWKQIMIALFPTLGTALIGRPRLVKEALLTSTGFTTKLFSGELLAVSSGRYVVWGIETELKRSWWKALFRLETATLSALGSVQYAAFTAKQIQKLKPRLVNAYLSFLRQVSYPCAKIQQSRTYRRGFIAPFVPKGRVRPVAAGDIPVVAVVPRQPEDIAVRSVAEVAIPDAGVPSVPNFPPIETDLRVTDRPSDSGK